jgi:hypothetical protein
MKAVAFALSCLCALGVPAEDKTPRFAATLPNGVTVELVGVSFHSLDDRSEPAQWWKPDGSDLAVEPYRRPRSGTSPGGGYYACEFALRITGAEDYSCATYNALGRSNVQPAVPLNEKNESVPGLLAFIGKFRDNQLDDTIRVGVSTEPWRTVEEWVDDAWQKRDPDNIVFRESKNALILAWPRQKGRAVILEMVRAEREEARRMLVFDRADQCHTEGPRFHGEGLGLIKEQYWFWNMEREDMFRVQYQTRPYQWVEFRNVSLQPGKRTNVEVIVQGAYAEMGLTGAAAPAEAQDLGYVLDRLAANLRFPTSGLARYRIEERVGPAGEPRFLRCVYTFRGPLYAFEMAEAGKSDRREYFDGRRSCLWMVRDRTAQVWEGQRQHRPIYRLDRFCPTDIMDELSSHDVEFLGHGRLKGVPCALLESLLGDKSRLRVWVAAEPNQFPLRIERYARNHLLYLYEAENLRRWDGIVFPERIRKADYYWDDAQGATLLSSFCVTVDSFEPTRHPAFEAFQPQFFPGISVTKHESSAPNPAAFEPALPERQLPAFDGIVSDFRPEQAKGKRLLICFFDLAQRPSRHCFTQLAQQAEPLGQKGVTLVGLEASQADKSAVGSWLVEQNIRVPVGRIEGDPGQVKSAWGVRSLPWLILTDANHIVRAEGFTPDELGKMLE